jgi:hypothetical protein
MTTITRIIANIMPPSSRDGDYGSGGGHDDGYDDGAYGRDDRGHHVHDGDAGSCGDGKHGHGGEDEDDGLIEANRLLSAQLPQ